MYSELDEAWMWKEQRTAAASSSSPTLLKRATLGPDGVPECGGTEVRRIRGVNRVEGFSSERAEHEYYLNSEQKKIVATDDGKKMERTI